MFGLPKRKVLVVGALVLVAVVYLVKGGKSFSETTDSFGTSGECHMTVIADVLNVRTQPQDGAKVIAHYKHGATVGADTVVRNGYRELDDNRWAASKFLDAAAGSHC